MRQEIILKIMGNREESQRGGGLNLEDQEIANTMVKHGIRRNIDGLKRKMKETNKKETRRQL